MYKGIFDTNIVKYYTIKLNIYVAPRNALMPLVILIIQSEKQRLIYPLPTADLSSMFSSVWTMDENENTVLIVSIANFLSNLF